MLYPGSELKWNKTISETQVPVQFTKLEGTLVSHLIPKSNEDGIYDVKLFFFSTEDSFKSTELFHGTYDIMKKDGEAIEKEITYGELIRSFYGHLGEIILLAMNSKASPYSPTPPTVNLVLRIS